MLLRTRCENCGSGSHTICPRVSPMQIWLQSHPRNASHASATAPPRVLPQSITNPPVRTRCCSFCKKPGHFKPKCEKYIKSLTFFPIVEKITKMNIPGNLHHVPNHIIKHIHNKSLYYIKYNFSLFDRKIIIHFVTETDNHLEIYNNYIKRMLMWLYILNNQTQNKMCSRVLNIYVYFSTITKELPKKKDYILDENNANTAYTYACKEDNIIVIYRKEEWFKVFIHETFHSFGMDFASMNTSTSRKQILEIFNVNSEVNLFEAYSEFWARIINSLFVSYFHCNKTNKDFLIKSDLFIYLERMYSFFQMIKVLKYMNINYYDFFSTNSSVKIKYREKSNIWVGGKCNNKIDTQMALVISDCEKIMEESDNNKYMD
jgi:hypothetical protein